MNWHMTALFSDPPKNINKFQETALKGFRSETYCLVRAQADLRQGHCFPHSRDTSPPGAGDDLSNHTSRSAMISHTARKK